MKQIYLFKRLFASFVLLLMTSLSWAYDFEDCGIYYDLRYGNNVAVTYKNYNSYSGWVIIPSSVWYNGQSYAVTSIGDYAFRGCSGITYVIIGKNVTSIGDYAFLGCSGLTKVMIFSNRILSRDYSSSDNNLKNIFGEQVREYIIDGDITSIGNNAFSGCSGLTSVTIGNSVKIIGNNAFSGCSGLTSVTIGNSVKTIGNNAFSGCSGLTSITIPNSVKSICGSAFSGCSGLTSITIPNSVTSIGQGAFRGCSGLTSVTIPEGITSIESSTFSACSGLTSVTIGNSVKSIGDYAFSGCYGLTSVTIGNSVKSIGDYAFSGCSALASVTCFAESIPTTGSDVFFKSPIGHGVLYVPKSSVISYKYADQWKEFDDILPIVPSVINVIKGNTEKEYNPNAPIYDLMGRRLQQKPTSGYYIQGGKKYFLK